MPELALAGEDHGDALLVGRFDQLLVAHGPAGLDDHARAGGQAVGIGAGQQSRVDAGEIAARKAAGRAKGGACATDAFYPFRDGLDVAAAAGVGVVIQPGGSIRDQELIDAADEQGIAMVLTGERQFRH